MQIQRACVLCLVAILAVVFTGENLMAQNMGFRIGIAPAINIPMVTPGFAQPFAAPFGVAPSTFGFPATQAPFIVGPGGFGVHQGFGHHQGFGQAPFGCCAVQTPQIIFPGQVFVPGQIIGPAQVFVPAQTIGVPGQVFVPGQTVFPQPTFFPQPTVFPGQAVFPGQVFVPGTIVTPGLQPATFGVAPTAPGMPSIGTPRTQVLSQFGPPTVSIITSTGETLYFNGGITIFIQNGQVASPR